MRHLYFSSIIFVFIFVGLNFSTSTVIYGESLNSTANYETTTTAEEIPTNNTDESSFFICLIENTWIDIVVLLVLALLYMKVQKK